MTFLFGGHETTGSTMSWVFTMLNDRRDIAHRIRQEYSQVVAKHGSLSTWEAADELKLTLAVIQETMRLRPTVYQFLPRRVQTDDNLPTMDGTSVCITKAPQLIDTTTIHRNPKFWTNAESFEPDRFLEGTEAWMADLELRGGKPHAFFYLPFSGGTMNCIGYRFALAEMQIIVAMFLSQFEVELTPTANTNPLFTGVILRPLNLEVTLRPVDVPTA
ncbi:Aste57867_17479 [Aphanomyces stellatus]|uniref:Aste57867_17479 protein n=1 Tax=Aphanomyces stellatus TaxID=120398 RepID=A0A485L7U0_9STRA|nr:hypothetical protein As57867_017419 [Aphanomyces stellatus]VFT94232.1 Aste57867_17479 [Aphanomyces stellatus]